MGYLVSKGINGVISYKGTQYVNPDKGTRRLCLRTGTGQNDVAKYGLTSNSSASGYCGMKMRVEGNVAYIGRSEKKETRSGTGNFGSKSTVSTKKASQRSITTRNNQTVTTGSQRGSYALSTYTTTTNIYTYSKNVDAVASVTSYLSSSCVYSITSKVSASTMWITSSSRVTTSSMRDSFLEWGGEDNFNL